MALVIENAAVFDGERLRSNSSVIVDGEFVSKLVSTGSETPFATTRVDLNGHRLLPGFVDIQVNGGGGALFNADPTVATLRRIADAHVQFGTTSMLPTLISDDLDVMRDAIKAVREAIDQRLPGIAGIHLEGPFINEVRKGAHDASKFRTIDDQAMDILTSLGSDAVTLVTLAPEKVDLSRIRELADAGVVVFAGHTAATFDQCKSAEDAGVSGYTHLYNAMTQFGSREPGVVGAAIDSKTACFGIIADGHHAHPFSVQLAVQNKYRGGAVLVTDAMPTVGSDDSYFELGGERIEVLDGVLRNKAGSLAGSHLTMVEAIRNAAQFAGLDWEEAVRMATVYPSDAIGCSTQLGRIAQGRSADFVEVNQEFEIVRVWRRGQCAFGPA